MNTKFQIQLKLNNYNKSSQVVSYDISLNDLGKFSNLAEFINRNSGKKSCNWFNHLPTIWKNNKTILDVKRLYSDLKENFGYEMKDVNLVKKFFFQFTPYGADNIEYVKFYKVEEI